MKSLLPVFAVLVMLYATGARAEVAPRPSCTEHREVIRSGDASETLTRRAGVGAKNLLAWLTSADSSTKKSLRRLRPGDVFDICVTTAPDGRPSIAKLAIHRDNPAPKVAVLPTQKSGALFPRMAAGSDRSDKRQAASRNVASTGIDAMPRLIEKPLTPRLPFKEALTRVLGRSPVLAAILRIARSTWHLPAHIPRDSPCVAVFLPARKEAEADKLAYVRWRYRGRTLIAYHYVDAHGHAFVVGADGRGYAVLDPQLPIADARLSSGWGWRIQPVLGGPEFHKGLDYAAPPGTAVYAAFDGVVSLAEWHGNYGRMIELKHKHGMSTRYGHLVAFAPSIRPGEIVRRGELIGYVGSTGLSTGPHLYYELWMDGVRVDPSTHVAMIFPANLDREQRNHLRTYIEAMHAPP